MTRPCGELHLFAASIAGSGCRFYCRFWLPFLLPLLVAVMQDQITEWYDIAGLEQIEEFRTKTN